MDNKANFEGLFQRNENEQKVDRRKFVDMKEQFNNKSSNWGAVQIIGKNTHFWFSGSGQWSTWNGQKYLLTAAHNVIHID